MRGIVTTITWLLMIACFAQAIFIVYILHGIGWAIFSIFFPPATMIIAPIMSWLSPDYQDPLPIILVGVTVVWLFITSWINSELDESDAKKQQLLRASQSIDRMLMEIDASYTANGEIVMDYDSFDEHHYIARQTLGSLGIKLPSLNAGGDGKTFHRTLKRIAAYARKGDINGARDAARW